MPSTGPPAAALDLHRQQDEQQIRSNPSRLKIRNCHFLTFKRQLSALGFCQMLVMHHLLCSIFFLEVCSRLGQFLQQDTTRRQPGTKSSDGFHLHPPGASHASSASSMTQNGTQLTELFLISGAQYHSLDTALPFAEPSHETQTLASSIETHHEISTQQGMTTSYISVSTPSNS